MRASRTLALTAALVALVALATACKNRLVAVVDGVLLADATSPLPVPEAPRVKVLVAPQVADAELPLPAAGLVQLVIEREVPWARVSALLTSLSSRKLEAVLLVGDTHKVRRFVLNDELPRYKRFTITGDAKGKFCVQTAELPKAYCVQGSDRKHIHRAFVRETVREVVKKWDMRQVMVYVDPAMQWADVVRLVDGARTCCGRTKVAVAVAAEAPLGPDAEAGNPAIRAAAIRAEEEATAEDSGAKGEAAKGEGAGPPQGAGSGAALAEGDGAGEGAGAATGAGPGQGAGSAAPVGDRAAAP